MALKKWYNRNIRGIKTYDELVTEQLETAEIKLLEANNQLDWWNSQVHYFNQVIKRLESGTTNSPELNQYQEPVL